MGYVKEISLQRFNTLFYRRRSLVPILYKEIKWYELLDGKLLGCIALDLSDYDYNYTILGRDAQNVFRAIDNNCNYETPRIAYKNMIFALQKYASDNQNNYPQGDEIKAPNDLFTPIIPSEKMHPLFCELISNPIFEAAKELIKEIAYAHIEQDANYIREFQSRGFEARLWELYLYRYFVEENFDFDSQQEAPDFLVSKFGKYVSIEATIIDKCTNPTIDITEENITSYVSDYFPIRFGSSLFSKKQKTNKDGKRYWEYEHVKGRPFVIAIHDYHWSPSSPSSIQSSMTWSFDALVFLLYGINIYNNHPIKEHKWQNKVIPSNFFAQKDSENISAVLFSNQATLPKFLRMGKLAGMGSKDINIITSKLIYSLDEKIIKKTENINNTSYTENWCDGIIMLHNPYAKFPVDPNLFPSITHLFLERDTNQIQILSANPTILSINNIILRKH